MCLSEILLGIFKCNVLFLLWDNYNCGRGHKNNVVLVPFYIVMNIVAKHVLIQNRYFSVEIKVRIGNSV